jgi:hypothetical protein
MLSAEAAAETVSVSDTSVGWGEVDSRVEARSLREASALARALLLRGGLGVGKREKDCRALRESEGETVEVALSRGLPLAHCDASALALALGLVALAVSGGEGVALPVARALVLVEETLGEALALRAGVEEDEKEALRLAAPEREADAQGVAEALRDALAKLDCVVEADCEREAEEVDEAEAQGEKVCWRVARALGVPAPGEALGEREALGLRESLAVREGLREALGQSEGSGLRVALGEVLALAQREGEGEALAQGEG